MRLLRDPATGRQALGIAEAGLPAFEQMLFAKYSLYRTVYFHRDVRAATVMMRKLVVAALEAELLDMAELREWTDEELFTLLRSRVTARRRPAARVLDLPQFREKRTLVGQLIGRILERKLYHVAASLPLSMAPRLTPQNLAAVERHLAQHLGLEEGQALVDIPSRPGMLSTDLLIERESGDVINAKDLTPDDGFAMNAAARAFYLTSGRLRLYTAVPVAVSTEDFARAIHAAVHPPQVAALV
jgi:HD superfamily phosphohydrolase